MGPENWAWVLHKSSMYSEDLFYFVCMSILSACMCMCVCGIRSSGSGSKHDWEPPGGCCEQNLRLLQGHVRLS